MVEELQGNPATPKASKAKSTQGKRFPNPSVQLVSGHTKRKLASCNADSTQSTPDDSGAGTSSGLSSLSPAMEEAHAILDEETRRKTKLMRRFTQLRADMTTP